MSRTMMKVTREDTMYKNLLAEFKLRNYEHIKTPAKPYMNEMRELVFAVARDPLVNLNPKYTPREWTKSSYVTREHQGLVLGMVIQDDTKVKIGVLRQIAVALKDFEVSRVMLFTSKAFVHIICTRVTNPIEQRDKDEFGGVLWELRSTRELHYDITSMKDVPRYVVMTLEETIRETLRDDIPPTGWDRWLNTSADVRKYGLMPGQMCKVYGGPTKTVDCDYQLVVIVEQDQPFPLHEAFLLDSTDRQLYVDLSTEHERDAFLKSKSTAKKTDEGKSSFSSSASSSSTNASSSLSSSSSSSSSLSSSSMRSVPVKKQSSLRVS